MIRFKKDQERQDKLSAPKKFVLPCVPAGDLSVPFLSCTTAIKNPTYSSPPVTQSIVLLELRHVQLARPPSPLMVKADRIGQVVFQTVRLGGTQRSTSESTS